MTIKGVSFGFMARRGYYAGETGREEIRRICAAGVTHVALIVEMMQDTYASTRVYADYEYTVSDLELADAIRRFRSAGVRVMLKPMVECRDSVWRGRIHFPPKSEMIVGTVADYAARWFESYRRALTHYARLAEEAGAEMFCVGCELSGLEAEEAHWSETVRQVRACYRGAVTYNGNQYTRRDPAFVRNWFRALDSLGISFYTGVQASRPTAADVARELRPAVDLIGELAGELGMPILFAEMGARSVVDGTRVPSRYDNTGDYDGDAQKNYLEGVLRAFSPYPWWAGFFWWKWDEHQERPQYRMAGGDTGFTLRGKPAEKVFIDWRPVESV